MEFNLDARTASLSVGEFSGFTLGPHDSGGGRPGIWRAQLGTHWHNELRAQATAEHAAAAEFEVPITGKVFHRGWTLTLTGRIDQLLRPPPTSPPATCNQIDYKPSAPDRLAAGAFVTLREIKTVTHPLPTPEADLRAQRPEYFVQLATYVALRRIATPAEKLRAELVFVETASGLAQTVALTPADDALFLTQLERVTEFLRLRARARERLRHLRFRPAFATPRPGQETTQRDLTTTFERHPLVLFEAPTGFGKTGVLLEFALGQLRSGHFDRALYLTSKATGQLQVVRTLTGMTQTQPPAIEGKQEAGDGRRENIPETPEPVPPASPAVAVAAWHVRNKSEHCINHTFHCVRDSCDYLAGAEARWPESGLARFYLDDHHARDLDTLRAAGRAARICPYEITRAALAFNDVWIGDYNYVFAPRNRTLFFDQPGFDPARTLLLLDEAHNLPSRVADSHSHVARADDARALLTELDHLAAPIPLIRAWESWTQLLAALQPVPQLDPALEADAVDTLAKISDQVALTPLDSALLGPRFSETLWQSQQLAEWLANATLKKLLWSPRAGELHFTCLDAADAIGETLRAFGGAVFASATLSPVDSFTESCGLTATPPAHLRATTPWRDAAYDIAFDARVDTSFQHRSLHYATTAATIAALHESAHGPVAVFFPSYAYAESIARELERAAPLRVALQPRVRDLAAQTAWVEESLAFSDALFLVLGSSFSESIDVLGGRVTHAMVVGPALPEVNAVQRARLAECSALGRAAAFRRVYQIPGMTKVNQALGRLVRGPGQRARVILHCRRFLDLSYASLLARDYQLGANLHADADLAAWLAR
ncbi:MAG: helicase [Opitutus sp.]|nr:helicase [Opitutus sp.]